MCSKMEAVIPMLNKLKRSIETMPRPAYIFLKAVLLIAAMMLAVSCLLFAFGRELSQLRLAQQLLESPAGVLLLGAVGLAFLLDRA